MTEQQFIAQEQAKQERKTRRALNHVRRTGETPSQWWLEAFLGMDWIRFTGPNENNQYNHYELTEKAPQ